LVLDFLVRGRRLRSFQRVNSNIGVGQHMVIDWLEVWIFDAVSRRATSPAHRKFRFNSSRALGTGPDSARFERVLRRVRRLFKRRQFDGL
jgi:hypothetical protein